MAWCLTCNQRLVEVKIEEKHKKMYSKKFACPKGCGTQHYESKPRTKPK